MSCRKPPVRGRRRVAGVGWPGRTLWGTGRERARLGPLPRPRTPPGGAQTPTFTVEYFAKADPAGISVMSSADRAFHGSFNDVRDCGCRHRDPVAGKVKRPHPAASPLDRRPSTGCCSGLRRCSAVGDAGPWARGASSKTSTRARGSPPVRSREVTIRDGEQAGVALTCEDRGVMADAGTRRRQPQQAGLGPVRSAAGLDAESV
jgi:hypothetical protein